MPSFVPTARREDDVKDEHAQSRNVSTIANVTKHARVQTERIEMLSPEGRS
jgi:hypothetical protein